MSACRLPAQRALRRPRDRAIRRMAEGDERVSGTVFAVRARAANREREPVGQPPISFAMNGGAFAARDSSSYEQIPVRRHSSSPTTDPGRAACSTRPNYFVRIRSSKQRAPRFPIGQTRPARFARRLALLDGAPVCRRADPGSAPETRRSPARRMPRPSGAITPPLVSGDPLTRRASLGARVEPDARRLPPDRCA
jgi:hypothetical protein